MSVILEVYYRSPIDHSREERITAEVVKSGGKLAFREEPNEISRAVCLTFEFSDREVAKLAASAIRLLGEHVEGPSDYE
jgi:hypothetical protein